MTKALYLPYFRVAQELGWQQALLPQPGDEENENGKK